MTWDEMKNRISLALKEPILQRVFEIICKELTELGKENTELREELNYAKTHCLFHSDCPTQKENAELKEQNTNLQTMLKAEREVRCNEEYLKKVTELEAQIEKMKNWCNCKNYQQCLIELAEQGKGMNPSECCVNCKKWEIKEK